MGFSGGGVSFSGGPYTYGVSYSAPSYTPDPGWSVVAFGTTNTGPSSVSCGGSASQGYYVTVYSNTYGTETYNTSVGGTAPACPVSYPPVWTDQSLAGFQAGVAYSDGVSATNGPSYSVSSGSLPSGISLNTGSGAVTGTPSTAGQSYSFVLRAANGDGAVTASFSGTVGAAPTAGKWQVWTGSTWVYGPVKVWDGSSWVTGSVKVWNGTAWVSSV